MNSKTTTTLLLQQLDALSPLQKDSLTVRYIQSLIRRAEQQRPTVAALLLQKAQQQLQHLENTPENQANQSAAPNHGLAALKQLNHELNTGQQTIPAEPSSGLAMDNYLQHQEQLLLQETGLKQESGDENNRTGFATLRAERLFRERQLERFADELVQQAIHDAPENPGPLNPQMLAIRSLTVMRELSPHYLSRFVSQVDTLFWLEHSEKN